MLALRQKLATHLQTQNKHVILIAGAMTKSISAEFGSASFLLRSLRKHVFYLLQTALAAYTLGAVLIVAHWIRMRVLFSG
jgi:hypothetical protein